MLLFLSTVLSVAKRNPCFYRQECCLLLSGARLPFFSFVPGVYSPRYLHSFLSPCSPLAFLLLLLRPLPSPGELARCLSCLDDLCSGTWRGARTWPGRVRDGAGDFQTCKAKGAAPSSSAGSVQPHKSAESESGLTLASPGALTPPAAFMLLSHNVQLN